MATKKTKAPSKGRANKTKAKKSGIFSKVNFNSPKTRFLTAVLIVGVIGGGFMAYRSFAATPYAILTGPDMAPRRGIASTTETQGSKRNTRVARPDRGKGLLISRTSDPSAQAKLAWGIGSKPRRYARVCASVRIDPGSRANSARLSINTNGVFQSSGTVKSGIVILSKNSSGHYYRLCTPNSSIRVGTEGAVVNVVNHTSDATIRVASIYVEPR